MKLLFVCSGNSCRSPMAMAIAQKCFGDQVECDSAAGNLENDEFKAGGNVSRNAVAALQTYGIDISCHQPKPLSIELVANADWVLFLGQRFRQNGKVKYPEFGHKMIYYGSYQNLLAPPSEMNDIPDPFDGQSWGNLYLDSCPWPGKNLESYILVARTMMEFFQPQLEKRLEESSRTRR